MNRSPDQSLGPFSEAQPNGSTVSREPLGAMGAGPRLLVDFAGVRALVVGDLMLDCFSFGRVSRISPEAPVPVLKVMQESRTLGGGGNVAANIAALGAEAVLVGAVGTDAHGRMFRDLLANSPFNIVDATICVPSRPTTLKTRLIAQNQQIARADYEDTEPLPEGDQDVVIARVREWLPQVSIVCVSDYDKGLLSDRVLETILVAAHEAGKPVFIDPKRADFASYRGASLVKPNVAELARATGLPCDNDAEVEAAAHHLIDRFGVDVLLTRSNKGMSLFRSGQEPLHMPTTVREVYDVCGAGDTVLAAFAIATASGRTRLESMRIANAAAGIAVTQQGTTTVSLTDLAESLAARRTQTLSTAPSTWNEAIVARHSWSERGLRVGFTNGCFDLIHPGHISLLRHASAACDRLIVGLNTDASVRRLKGPLRPIQTEGDRALVVAALGMVDLVVLFDQDTPLQLITALSPDLLVKGADYRPDEVVGADMVRAAGGQVLHAPLLEGKSTSALVARLTAAL